MSAVFLDKQFLSVVSYVTSPVEEERVEGKSSEFLNVDGMVLKPLDNFQSFSVNDLECLEGSGVQINV